MKILLAVDGSSYTKKMLAYLVEHKSMLAHAQQTHTLLTVMPALPKRARDALGKEIVLQYYADAAQGVLQPVLKLLARHDIHPEALSKVGSPAEIIAKVASEGAYDLVLMGSHGQGALGNLVMGSVATQVLAQCKVPVLLVR